MKTILVVVSLLFLSNGLPNRTLAANRYKVQNLKPKTIKPNDTVGIINGTPVTYKELVNNYYKSSPERNDKVTYKELSDYLNLYMDYKAKLLEAKKAGYYQNKDILKEFNNYRQQFAYSYWFDHKIKPEMVNQLVSRSRYELHVMHILIRLSPSAPPSDTIKVWNKLMEARKKFQEGVPFEKLVKEYSSKNKEGKPYGGDLGYLSAAQTIKVFEDHVYSTPVGHVSMPFRSRFGYHIIYVIKKRPTVPERLASHIYFNTHGHNNSVDKAMAKARKAYALLQKGVPWDTVVSKYSEDPYSKINNGSLGWMNHNKFRPSLSDTIFSIKTPHTYTHPFKSFYGIHIVRLDSIRSFKNEQQRRNYFLKKLKKLPRYSNYERYVTDAAKDYGHARSFGENYSTFRKSFPENGKIDFKTWHLSEVVQSKPLYEINNHDYTAGDFQKWLINHFQGKKNFKYNYGLFEIYEDYCVKDQLVSIADKLFPKFEKQSTNYLDGLVSYQITQDSVWNYVNTDTAKLKQLYKKDPHRYRFGTRYKFHQIVSNKQSLIDKAVSMIKSGVPVDSVQSRMEKMIKKDSSSYLNIRHNMVNDISDFPYTYLADMKPHQVSNEFTTLKHEKSVLYLDKKLSPRQMTFKEAYNALVSEYQPIRKKKWLHRLEAEFSVKKYPEVIKKALEEQ